MKISKSLILQTTVWVSIWLVFALTGSDTDRPASFYFLITLRVVGFILFFNVFYYALLPLYFSERKRIFFLLSPLVFIAYTGLSVAVDFTVGEWQRKETLPETTEEGERHNKIPLRFMIIPPIFLGISLFGAAATFRGFAAFENKKKAEEEANRRRLEAEIALLKSQINPHFLLNTLNNLYALSLTEPEKTPDSLFKLSEMVSYILYECASPKVSLARDLEFVNSYIELQRLRLPPNAGLQVSLPDAFPDTMQIEPMILIPFIENAFKHGLTTKQPCDIQVDIQIKGQELTLKVKNQVFPAKTGQSGNPSGVGMANTRQRLEHSYRGRYQLRVEKDEHKHRVELLLNLAV